MLPGALSRTLTTKTNAQPAPIAPRATAGGTPRTAEQGVLILPTCLPTCTLASMEAGEPGIPAAEALAALRRK